MSETIGVIAMGEMGSATARRLRERGATVVTSLAGRSAASAARAEKAGAIPVATDDEFVAQSAFILSIVPPGDAVALAERLAPAIKRAGRKTGLCRLQRGLAADRGGDRQCAQGNRLHLRRCRDRWAAAERDDAHDLLCVGRRREGLCAAYRLRPHGPRDGRAEWRGLGDEALLCGHHQRLHGDLLGHDAGLDARRHGGCAAAGAVREPADAAELDARLLSRMPPKAYRWVAEMEEIAQFQEDDPAARDMYLGIARFYEQIAAALEARKPGDAVAQLEAFCAEREGAKRKSA